MTSEKRGLRAIGRDIALRCPRTAQRAVPTSNPAGTAVFRSLSHLKERQFQRQWWSYAYDDCRLHPIISVMRAMVLEQPQTPLQLREVPQPKPGPGQLLVRVSTCAVCRTDLHIADGELPDPKLPLIPGHQIVGRIEQIGEGVHSKFENGNSRFEIGGRVGIPWLGWTDGECSYCRSGRENLCDRAQFTGYTIDGGYAEFAVADARFCFRLPDKCDDVVVAPLLCAGMLGYRSLRKTGDPLRLGIYGFGAAAHLIAQVAIYEGRQIFAFTRPGDDAGQDFARKLGAVWAGGSDQMPPEKLDAAIIFAPVGALVPLALRALAKGGIVVCGGIHMSDIPSFAYIDLWGERTICSVANLTRRDGEEFLSIAPRVPVQTETQTFQLEEANTALDRLRSGKIEGAAVLIASKTSS
jgi:propanol-preferring alcohol dehydrogenase